MVDLEELRRAGISTKSKGWMTNPLRRLLWPLIRPYLAVLASVELPQYEPPPPVELPDIDGMVRTATRTALIGIEKDVLAIAYRLGSIETGLAQLHELIHLAQAKIGLVQAQIADHDTAVQAMSSHVQNLVTAVQGLEVRLPDLERLIETSGSRGTTFEGTTLRIVSTDFGSFLVRRNDLIGKALARGEFWDRHLKGIIERAANPDLIAIDAGAYLGFHSVYMSGFFREVWSFEPQEEMYRTLCANLLLNGCHNVHAMNAGLWDKPGRIHLAASSKQEVHVPFTEDRVDYDLLENAAALTFDFVEDCGEGTVPALTIDSLGKNDVGFIKIDTQGADYSVLAGARETISRCRPVVAFEYERELSDAHGASLTDYEEFFKSIDYRINAVEVRGEGKQTDYLAMPSDAP